MNDESTTAAPTARLLDVALVAIGGAAGTAAREALTLAIPALPGFPLAIFLINLGGAFLLGLLVERLSRPTVTPERARRLRLLLGTGVLGGFTTYSALAVDGVLFQLTEPHTGLLYAAGTLILGALATFAGIAVGARGSEPTT